MQTSERVKAVVELFGVKPQHEPAREVMGEAARRPLLPAPGQVVLVTGPSGAGKSSLLRALRDDAERAAIAWIDLGAIELPDVAVIDCATGELQEWLGELSRVGLAEVWTYLRKPSELSDGQRWRLRLALALRQAKSRRGRVILAADEFAALLDRVTAVVVARALRRSVGRVGVIVATSHEDLAAALEADVRVRCDFGQVQVQRISRAGTFATGR